MLCDLVAAVSPELDAGLRVQSASGGLRKRDLSAIGTGRQARPAERIQYLNCDLPVAWDMVADPELFFQNAEPRIIVFDGIDQLRDPSRLLKIDADLFARLRVLATGSSTLAASEKLRDTLTGCKRLVHLTPLLWDGPEAFQGTSLVMRLYHGGLPEAFLADAK